MVVVTGCNLHWWHFPSATGTNTLCTSVVPPVGVRACACMCVCVRACVRVTLEASHVLPVLPDKEGPCLLCVCFLYVVVAVVCVCGVCVVVCVCESCVCVRVHVVCVCVCVCVYPGINPKPISMW